MPVTLSLTVNGKKVTADVDPRTLLVDFLRNELGAHRHARRLRHRPVRRLHRASRRQRGQGVHDPRRAGERRRGLTIEGLAAADGTMHPMQAAFKECHGLQCGFCTPGMVMSAIDLVKRHPKAVGADDPRGARRQLLPLHRLPEHRQGGAARRRGDGQVGGRHGCHRAKRHRRVGPPQGGLPLPHRRRPVHRRRQSAEPDARVLPALAARAREDPQDRHGQGEGGCPAWSRSSPAPTSKASTACPAAGSSPAPTASR